MNESIDATREDVNSQTSTYRGLIGLYERVLRRHRELFHALTCIPIFLLVILLAGISLVPTVALFDAVFHWAAKEGALGLRWLVTAISIAAGFFLYGFTSIFVVSFANLFLRSSLSANRGPYYSVKFIPWYLHNALTYILRYTFLNFITPTPFNLIFYRYMGMKIGKNVQINTSNISDPALIVLEDGVTIGGSATLLAHYGMSGYLITAPLVIRKNATIGLRAIVMGGAEIGEGAKVLPNSVVMPKTKIPAGETWGGNPAQKI